MRPGIGLCLVAATVLSARAADGALAQVTSFGSNPGALDMYEYVPAGLPPGRPLVVVMHGCTQMASSMEVAGWNALADQYRFAVVYPQQRSANQSTGCFVWWSAADDSRGMGEAESVAQMIDAEIAAHGIDAQRVYVTGLSAGAAFTAVMLAAYPDRVAAGSIMSGLPYMCATTISGASACQQMTASAQKTPQQWGDLVRAADSGFSGPWPRVQIWQGSADYVVHPANATELVKQWTNVWGIDQTATATETIRTATRTQYASGDTVAVELYLVDGMGHAVATGSDALGACPATTGAFFADEQICSTLRAAQFFGLVAGSGSDPNGSNGGGDGDAGMPHPTAYAGSCDAGGGGAGALGALVVAIALRRRRGSGRVLLARSHR
ncbi:MAG: alpha/beta hydrolase family esterase [Acidobacteriota bacterium]